MEGLIMLISNLIVIFVIVMSMFLTMRLLLILFTRDKKNVSEDICNNRLINAVRIQEQYFEETLKNT